VNKIYFVYYLWNYGKNKINSNKSRGKNKKEKDGPIWQNFKTLEQQYAIREAILNRTGFQCPEENSGTLRAQEYVKKGSLRRH